MLIPQELQLSQFSGDYSFLFSPEILTSASWLVSRFLLKPSITFHRSVLNRLQQKHTFILMNGCPLHYPMMCTLNPKAS